MVFAATGRLTCNKLVCNDTNCHNVKNHSGYPPLPRNPDIQAAAVVGIASNYGASVKINHKWPANDDGFIQAPGTYVPPPPKTWTKTVPPLAFNEEGVEDE